MKLIKEHWFPLLIFLVVFIVILRQLRYIHLDSNEEHKIPADDVWHAPPLFDLPNNEESSLIRYGHDIIVNTAAYFGPEGKIAHISNGMNCQNCHLDAGTRPWGNNYGAVYATYPKFRERSGQIESIEKRVNDCMIRSLHGHPLDSTSKEMKAILSYIKFIGKSVVKGIKPPGSGIVELPLLKRPADSAKGRMVYMQKCSVCHMDDGTGVKRSGGIYAFPPVWGENSYTTGAGLYRISRLAGYVKTNMPFNIATYSNPQLTDEDAWDVAAFINSMPHPVIDISKDWPDIHTKPYDHPFGPFSDTFSLKQHKYGPYQPIRDAKLKIK